MSDVLVALRAMRAGIFSFLLVVIRGVLITAVVATGIAVTGYLLVHYLLVALGLVFLVMIGFWFWIEYERAVDTREYKELCKSNGTDGGT